MTIRQMRNEFEGWPFYESSFDTETGTLVRVTEESEDGNRFDGFLANHPQWGQDLSGYPGKLPMNCPKGEEREQAAGALKTWREQNPTLEQRWQMSGPGGRRGYNRNLAFSPVPETIDVKITNACGFSCPYCYMGSGSTGKHAPFRLIEKIFEGLLQAPYQVAIGGGEPTLHPELPNILHLIRSQGTVPNFTTAGHHLRADVIDAVNEFGGGVALTYHPHKGIAWFTKTFQRWKEALRPGIQLNVHVIADRDGAASLGALLSTFEGTQGVDPSDLNLVLLAYHPGLGRATMSRVMPKRVYMDSFPAAIIRAREMGAKVAFSEGLLPFFLSRPELGLDLTFATAIEGRFSCYVDDKGFVSISSFDPPGRNPEYESSIYETRLQDIWDAPKWWNRDPNGGPCYDCNFRPRCSAMDPTLQFTCKWQNVNTPSDGPPLTREAQEQQEFWAHIEEEAAKDKGDK